MQTSSVKFRRKRKLPPPKAVIPSSLAATLKPAALSTNERAHVMKPYILAAIAVLSAGPVLAAEQSPACLAKRAEIESGISAAQAHGNAWEVRGLRRALRANTRYCTTASLEAERNRDIARAADRVARRQADLEKAERRGNARKIAKERAQLEDARHKLSEAQRPLAQ
jgi:hypothetical protein